MSQPTENWQTRFDKEFNINQPPIIASTVLCDSDRVKSFIASVEREAEERFLLMIQSCEKGLDDAMKGKMSPASVAYKAGAEATFKAIYAARAELAKMK